MLSSPRTTCKRARLARDNHRLTVALDLDETLIHSELVDLDACEEEEEGGPNSNNSVFYLRLQEFTAQRKKVLVRKRPHLDRFLSAAAKRYNLVLFTAGLETYAEAVANVLDPAREIFSQRLFRQHCNSSVLECNGNETIYWKDLRVLESDLDRTVLVDNSALSFAKDQLENGVPIPSYINDANDVALIHLSELLAMLSKELVHEASGATVRPTLRRIFNLERKIEAMERAAAGLQADATTTAALAAI